MKNKIGNYSIEKYANGDLVIDYKRTQKDLFYILIYFIISLPILYLGFKLITYLVKETLNFNVIIAYLFSLCLLLFGLYFFIVAIGTFSKPTKKVIFINYTKKQLHIKLNILKKISFNINDIKQFNLEARDITIETQNNGRTYKRPLFLIDMNLELSNNKKAKIHQFEGSSLHVSNSEKALKDISKQLTEIISKECGKEYYWKGTRKE